MKLLDDSVYTTATLSMNSSNSEPLALLRRTVLADQTKKKRLTEQKVRDEKNPSHSIMCEITVSEEILKLSVEADATMPTKDSFRGIAGGKRWRDDALYDGFKSPVIAVVNKPRTYVNHSYRDFSQLLDERLHYTKKTKLEDMTFALKMHHVLSKRELQPCIGWKPHGRAFRIFIPKDFEKHICTEYFGMPLRYSSFLRQLNNHGFKQITQGPDRSCYYHEFFLRGMPWLCKYMPQPKNARLLIPDPENEPDFYTLSKLFPLPDQELDDIVPPSAHKKNSLSTQWGQSPAPSSTLATKFAFAHSTPNSAGQSMAALQHPMVSIAALTAPYSKYEATIMANPNVGVASNHDPDQLLLMLACALKEEQDRRYENALQRSVLQGDFAKTMDASVVDLLSKSRTSVFAARRDIDFARQCLARIVRKYLRD